MSEIFELLKWLIDGIWFIISFVIDILNLIFIVLPSSLADVSTVILVSGHLGAYLGAIVLVLLCMGVLRLFLAIK